MAERLPHIFGGVRDMNKIVPIEPTEEMIKASLKTGVPWPIASAYKAMLSAAPESDHIIVSRAEYEQMKANSCETIIQAFKDGYKIAYYEPWVALTDEANDNNAWGVERTKPPFCDKESRRYWTGKTMFEALNNAREAIDKAMKEKL